jgi:hypothetical protein
MAQNYQYSAYTPLTSDGGSWAIWRSAYKNIRFSLSLAQVITLTDGQAANLPGLSYTYYGSVDYWRVLLHYNGLSDPIQDVYAGMQFNIPTQASVVAWLTRQQSNTVTTRTI